MGVDNKKDGTELSISTDNSLIGFNKKYLRVCFAENGGISLLTAKYPLYSYKNVQEVTGSYPRKSIKNSKNSKHLSLRYFLPGLFKWKVGRDQI